MKERHACADRCRTWEGTGLFRRRLDGDLMAWPLGRLRLLPMVTHRCGPWCMPADSGGPVRLGRAGVPVSYDLGLSPGAAALLARLRR